MATIVENQADGKRYVLIGVAATEHATGDKWGPRLSFNSEAHRLVCVADEQGALRWFDSRDVRVESVGGVSAGDVLG